MWTPGQAPFDAKPETVLRWTEEQLRDLERALDIIGKRQPFPTLWSASVAPSLGNGTLIGAYTEVGAMLFYSFRLTAGSTTTFGTGQWAFSVPRVRVQAEPMFLGSAWAVDSSLNTNYVGVCRSSSTLSSPFVHVSFDQLADAQSNSPFVWATGDFLIATIAYPLE